MHYATADPYLFCFVIKFITHTHNSALEHLFLNVALYWSESSGAVTN